MGNISNCVNKNGGNIPNGGNILILSPGIKFSQINTIYDCVNHHDDHSQPKGNGR